MKKSILFAAVAALMLTACGPTTTPTDPSTTEPSTTVPSTPTTEPSVTAPSVTDPSVSNPSVTDPSVPDPTDPSVDPTDPSVDPTDPTDPTDPIVPPELPSISDTVEEGYTRLYFLAESWWVENSVSTAIFTDSVSYPGVAMYVYEEIEDKVVYAYDVDLTTTSSVGFVAYSGASSNLPGTTISFLDIVMDTQTISVTDLVENNLIALNEDEADTSRSLYVFPTVYVPGQKDYERPERPVTPDDPNTGVEKTRIYFMDRDWWNYDDAKTSFYYWSSTLDQGEYAFPGVTARKLETIETDMGTVVNVYYADIDTTQYDSILFNRVSKNNVEGALASNTLNAQTGDIKISDMGENNMIILSHDEFVYDSNFKCSTILGVYEEGKWDYGQFSTGAVIIEPLPELVTVYYANPTWSSIYCYAWSDTEGSNAAWPGEVMTLNSDTNIWSYEFNTKYDKLIFNNGLTGEAEQKTTDLVLLGYTLDTPYWNGSKWAPVPGEIGDVETIRVYYSNPSKWTNVNAYVWDDYDNAKSSWPGEAMTLDSETGYWYFDFTSNYTNIIFNNGSSQTADISLKSWSVETPLYNGSTFVALDWTPGETPVGPGTDEPVETSLIYFDAGQPWKSDNARFAAYLWGTGVSATWVSAVDSDSDGIYEIALPEGNYTSIIFCRMNPASTANDWNNKWNQTIDLTIPTNGQNLFTITDPWAGSGAKGTWSTFAA